MTTTPAAQSIPVRLRGSVDIARSLPSLLGFRPRDSLVLVGTTASAGARRAVRCAMRVDLPGEPDPALVAELLGRAVVAGAVEVLAVVVDGPPGPPAGWHELFRAAGQVAGPWVVDTLGLADGRVWSASCRDPWCCPPEGAPVTDEAPGDLAAALALAGRQVLPGRQDVVDQVAPQVPVDDPGVAAVPAGLVLRRVRDRRWREVGPHSWRAAALRCADTRFRDAVIKALDELPADEAVCCALQLARAVGPADLDAGACAVLGWVAWQSGDGVLCRAAVERGLASEPRHRLCRLLEDVIEAGLPPDSLS